MRRRYAWCALAMGTILWMGFANVVVLHARHAAHGYESAVSGRGAGAALPRGELERAGAYTRAGNDYVSQIERLAKGKTLWSHHKVTRILSP